MNVIVDGLLTNYHLSGKGKLVLLLHGWGDSLAGVGGLQEALEKQYQVLTPDLPGFGATQPPKEAWDLDNYAEFLSHLLDKLNLRQPYAMVGHSNGGALAVRAISLGKLSPEKLVLLAAAGVRTGNKAKRFVLKVVAKVGNVATFWMPEHRRRALRKSLYGVAGSDMLVAPHLVETFRKTVRQDVQADAASIKTPTLLVYGGNDQAVPVADGRQYHRLIGNSKLEVLPDAGHFLHQEKPEAVIKLIEEFLA